MARGIVLIALALTIFGPRPSIAAPAQVERCRIMERGPERRACFDRLRATGQIPTGGDREAKYAHCSQLAIDRGFGTVVKFDPKKKFMRDCMRGRQS